MILSDRSLFTVEPGDHLCISYRDEDENRRLTAAHLATALERGHRIVYIVDSRSRQTVLGWLEAEAPVAPASLLTRGQLVLRSADEFAFTGGGFDPDRMVSSLAEESARAGRAGYAGLRVCAGTDWAVLGQPGCDRLVQYERQVSRLLTEGRLTGLALVCQFDQRRFPHQTLRRLREAHPIAMDARQAQQRGPLLSVAPLADRAGLRLSGEVDLSNVREFAAAVQAALDAEAAANAGAGNGARTPAAPGRDLHLDLADVSYLDVTAVGLLVRTAATLTDGRRLVLGSPGPTIRTTLRMLGWDELPALCLVDGWEGR